MCVPVIQMIRGCSSGFGFCASKNQKNMRPLLTYRKSTLIARHLVYAGGYRQ